MDGTILQPSSERKADRDERERRSSGNIDGKIEREGDATLNRLILKFCTQEPVLNHAKKKKPHTGKKPSSILFTIEGTIWMGSVPYRGPAGL